MKKPQTPKTSCSTMSRKRAKRAKQILKTNPPKLTLLNVLTDATSQLIYEELMLKHIGKHMGNKK